MTGPSETSMQIQDLEQKGNLTKNMTVMAVTIQKNEGNDPQLGSNGDHDETPRDESTLEI